MITELKLNKYRRYLKIRFPLVGFILSYHAIEILENEREDPRVVPLLVEYADSRWRIVSRRAERALASLKSRQAIDAICNFAVLNPEHKVVKICVKCGYRPSDEEDECLFLFVTRQLDEFFKIDPEFTILRLLYEHAEQRVKERILEVVRSGDIRCQPFAIQPRKALTECTEQEIKLAIDSCVRHKDWERLFISALELPLRYSLQIFMILRDIGWNPEKPDLRELFERIVVLLNGLKYEEFRTNDWSSHLFETWMGRGKRLEYQLLNEDVLFHRLEIANPVEAVHIVSALAIKGTRTERIIQYVRMHPHWFVRLAGLLTGLTKDIVMDRMRESNWWINELSGLPGVLEFWPSRATPGDLVKLNHASQSAYEGAYGIYRSILKEILAWKVTTGTFAEIVVDATPTSAEFVRVGSD
ncbi:MAG: hypothetical protein N2487_02405 [Verrucomicrobiae bacterium]|nr:hypothetical protein [Verrucomicrobiae bacterium]